MKYGFIFFLCINIVNFVYAGPGIVGKSELISINKLNLETYKKRIASVLLVRVPTEDNETLLDYTEYVPAGYWFEMIVQGETVRAKGIDGSEPLIMGVAFDSVRFRYFDKEFMMPSKSAFEISVKTETAERVFADFKEVTRAAGVNAFVGFPDVLGAETVNIELKVHYARTLTEVIYLLKKGVLPVVSAAAFDAIVDLMVIEIANGKLSELVINRILDIVQVHKRKIVSNTIHGSNAGKSVADFVSLHGAVRRVNKEGIVVLKNENSIIPVKDVSELNVLSIHFGAVANEFQACLDKYLPVKKIVINNDFQVFPSAKKLEREKWKMVIVSVFNKNINEKYLKQLSAIINNTKLDVVIVGEFNLLNKTVGIERFAAVVGVATDAPMVQKIAAQIIMGAQEAHSYLKNKHPLAAKIGMGVAVKSLQRFKYGLPEEEGLDSEYIYAKVDSIVSAGLFAGAFPGCQVLVAKNSNVVFHKAYGYHTYAQERKTKLNDVYDLASVSKITAPLPALIKLCENGDIILDKPMSDFYKPWIRSNKRELILRDILAHQAGLKPWIAFWKYAVDSSGVENSAFFRSEYSRRFPVKVAPSVFLHKKYVNIIYKQIEDSELRDTTDYKYSGLPFYIFPKVIEDYTGQDYEHYLKKTFYKPLGAHTITFNAYKHFDMKRIVPTEDDTFFRKTLLHGYVHDEGAAMLGGISGNAGLFATANDLAKIIQMYQNGGSYGGVRYFSEMMLNEFTKAHFSATGNRRGLGFDKPKIDNFALPFNDAYPSPAVSMKSFGHSGYTGTFVWADPENEILLIFLSNRVYPTRNNSRLYNMDIRMAIQQAVYDSQSVFKKQKKNEIN